MPQFSRETFTKVRFRGGSGSYILMPVLTTTQRDALTNVKGLIIYNSTTGQVEESDGSTWRSVGQGILTTHAATPNAHHTLSFPNTQVFSGTAPGSYTDLDLSSVVGVNPALVLLRVTITDAGNESFAFRKNGETLSNYAIYSNGYIHNLASTQFGYVWVVTDANGVIEWASGAGTHATTINVEAFIK